MGLFTSKYPTDWEEQEPVYLTKTIERKKYEVMMENGEEILVEADHVKKSDGSRYFYDINKDDLKLTPRPKIRKRIHYKLDEKLELKEDEIAAVKKEKVSETTYQAENVKYKEREVKERHYRYGPTVKTDSQLINRPEIIRQNDTE